MKVYLLNPEAFFAGGKVEMIKLSDYTQERTTLIAAIAFAMGHPGTPTSVYEKLRDALTSTLGKDSAS